MEVESKELDLDKFFPSWFSDIKKNDKIYNLQDNVKENCFKAYKDLNSAIL